MRNDDFHKRAAILSLLMLLLWSAGCAGSSKDGTDQSADTVFDSTAPFDIEDTHRASDGVSDSAPDGVSDSAPDGVGDSAPSKDSVEPSDTMSDAPQGEVITDIIDNDAQSDAMDAQGPYLPPKLWLTVNEIPALMNGSVPYIDNDDQEKPFRLKLPRQGFTIDIYPKDGTDNGTGVQTIPLKIEDLTVTVSVDIGEGEGLKPAGTNLASLFEALDDRLRWKVTPSQLFPVQGEVTISASIKDRDGNISDQDSLTVSIGILTPNLDPFVERDIWLIVLSRDHWEIGLPVKLINTFSLPTVYMEDGNGVADLDEDLQAIGFASSSTEISLKMKAWLIDVIRSHLYRFFHLNPDGSLNDESVNIAIYFEGDPEAPERADFSETGDFSMIAMGGDNDEGYNGYAWIDPNNQSVEDNTDYMHGVFTTSMLRQVLSIYPVALVLQPFLPGYGTPVGEDPADTVIFSNDFDPDHITDTAVKDRYETLNMLVSLLGFGLAAVTAHEMGHSLGLVPNGPPPKGLFGGESKAAFCVGASTSWHIDTEGLNIEQSANALDFGALLNDPTAKFNELNTAYLRQRLIVDPGEN